MMKKFRLLILTQKMDANDDLLGFVHGWVEEFAKNCEQLTVICLYEGNHNLPANVKVLSLGKEAGRSRAKYLFRFYKYIWRERKNYDAVFVHMNQEYVVLGGLIWRLLGKKIGLWYAHGYVPFSLRISAILAHIIFTSTKSGFNLPSKKVNIIGQGIDISKFQIKNQKSKVKEEVFKIITVGRISPSKDYATLINAAEILKNKGLNFEVEIIGGPGLKNDFIYFEKMKQLVKDKNLSAAIKFLGPIANKNISVYLERADLFVNMSHTGSLDKAILEAMAAGLPVLSCNESLLEVLGGYKESLMYGKGDFSLLAEKINKIMKISVEERQRLGENLRQIVVKGHSLENLITKIINGLKKNGK